jgi:hypothetical protein
MVDTKFLDPDRRVARALSQIMTGGDHLAARLVARVGADFAIRFPPDTDPEHVLDVLGATADYDMWCCWAAIMRGRAILEEPSDD